MKLFGRKRTTPASGNGSRSNGAPPKGGNPQRNGANGKQRDAIDRSGLKHAATEVPISVAGWLDERTGTSPAMRASSTARCPRA